MFGRNTVLKPVWDREPATSDLATGQVLQVNSIWSTIQGEGPHAGEPAIFIRLAGCNLRCHFCDTAFEKGETKTLREVINEVTRLVALGCATDLVVLTGGEPMRQQIIPLLARLDEMGFTTQIETAGSVWPPPAEIQKYSMQWEPIGLPFLERFEALMKYGAVELVCSPKTPALHPMIEKHCNDFKYIIRKGETSEADGLPIMSTQMEGRPAILYRPDPENVIPTIWVQPMAEYGLTNAAAGNDAVTEVPDKGGTDSNMRECIRIAMKHGYRISLQTHKILGVE